MKKIVLIYISGLLMGCVQTSPGFSGIIIVMNQDDDLKYVLGKQQCPDSIVMNLDVTGGIPDLVKINFSSATIQYAGKTENMIFGSENRYFSKVILNPCVNLFLASKTENFKTIVYDKNDKEIYRILYSIVKE